MRNILLITILICLLQSVTYCQNVSPLIAPLTNYSLIERPKVFSDMQIKFDKDIPNVKAGLELTEVYKKISEFKKEFLEKIKSPEFSKKTDDEIELSMYNYRTSFKIAIGKKVEDLLKDGKKGFKEELKTKIKSYIDKGLSKISENTEIQNSIIAGLLLSINNLDYLNEFGLKDVKSKNDFVDKIVENIFNKLEKEILDKYLNNFNDNLNITSLNDVDKIVSILNKASIESFELIKSKISDGIDKIDIELRSGIDRLNTFLLNANIGLSIKSNNGDFTSGLNLLMNLNEGNSQLGTFIIAQLTQSEDSTLPKKSLLGFQLRQRYKDRIQIDFLSALYFGSKNFKALESFEIGIGASARIGDNYLLGLSFYTLFLKPIDNTIPGESNNVKTIGLTFKPKSFPTLSLSYVIQNAKFNKGKFGFDIIYPINGN